MPLIRALLLPAWQHESEPGFWRPTEPVESAQDQDTPGPVRPESHRLMLPGIVGTIDRRILLNYRAPLEVVSRILPAQFRVRSVNDHALIGVCLIRFRALRPAHLPAMMGISSENAAHRISIVWSDDEETHAGVYVTRRDTDSAFVRLTGGRVFPGVHGRATFEVDESPDQVSISISDPEGVLVGLSGRISEEFSSEVFATHEEASRYFQDDRIGYSPARREGKLEGLQLNCHTWETFSLAIDKSHVREFSRLSSEIKFDHALIMHGISHDWSEVPTRCCGVEGSAHARHAEQEPDA